LYYSPAIATIEKTLPATEFSISPNPVTDGYFHISGPENTAIHIRIYDMLGKLVMNLETRTGENILVKDLKKGIYILRITSGSGKITTLKLVVK
jgi:hypothetical protein